MPIDSSTTYIPLDGSSRAGCWNGRTGLERKLIFLSIILALIVFVLSLAFALKKCEEPPSNSTTVSPSTTTLHPNVSTTITSSRPTSASTTTLHPNVSTTTTSARSSSTIKLAPSSSTAHSIPNATESTTASASTPGGIFDIANKSEHSKSSSSIAVDSKSIPAYANHSSALKSQINETSVS